jgi:hypothetical protein
MHEMVKPSRELAVKAATTLVPQYVSLLSDLRKEARQIAWSAGIGKIRSNMTSYVRLYEDERRIGIALLLGLLGEEDFTSLNCKLKDATESEQQIWIDEIASTDEADLESLFDCLPQSEHEWDVAKVAFNALSDTEKESATKQGAFFWAFFFSSFFNTLSLMIHGVKLTTLVPQAIAGDPEAFLKAAQIDRMLLIHHAYFRERKQQAQEQDEKDFLRKLLTREISSSLKSRIRYPGLYMLLGVLEAYQWLDDMKHAEILDIADAAGLDRFQNRIEDVNFVTKRLGEYRRWQKISSLSMQ